MSKKISVAILGVGSRGCGFGQEVQNDNERYELSAVCDINPKQLAKAKKLFSLSDEQIFSDEESFFSEKRADFGNVKICAVEKSPKSEIYAISNLFF